MTAIRLTEQWDLTKDRVLVEGEMQRLAPILASLVEHSFVTHPMRNRTSAEHTRRVDLMVKTYFALRQQGWTEQRSVSHLRTALTANLDTTQFRPVQRCSYVRDPILFPDAGPRRAIALIDSAQGD